MQSIFLFDIKDQYQMPHVIKKITSRTPYMFFELYKMLKAFSVDQSTQDQ